MFQITTKDSILGYSETVDYCYKLSSGSAQIIGNKERERGETATGIVYGGTVYSLPDHDDFEGAEPATVTEIDAAVVLTEQARQIKAERDAREAVEDAMCEADMLAEQRQEEIEIALCELDEGV